MDGQSRVFTEILPGAGRECVGNENEPGMEVRGLTRQRPSCSRLRELQVTGSAEESCRADQASLRVRVSSSKESVSEASSSVSRRLEYILQAVRQHGVSDKDTSVRRFLNRDADQFHMDAEVMVTFSDFEKMEGVSRVLLEKLDKSVCVGTPQFFHSAECLSQMRRRACVSAVENAQQKACEVSRLLGQTLGPPQQIQEEETKEWRSEEEENGSRGSIPCTPTITASSRVSVTFSLRDQGRKKT